MQQKLGEFAMASSGTKVEVAPGVNVVKGVPPADARWKRTYDEPMVSRAVPHTIAYLYLALCIGDCIYSDVLEPTRRTLRHAMAGDETADETWSFAPMRSTTPPEPKHGLGIVRAEDGGLLVHVGLFRDYVWRVPFAGVSLPGAAPFYLLDLATGQESFS